LVGRELKKLTKKNSEELKELAIFKKIILIELQVDIKMEFMIQFSSLLRILT
jgi:hypothetical protein